MNHNRCEASRQVWILAGRNCTNRQRGMQGMRGEILQTGVATGANRTSGQGTYGGNCAPMPREGEFQQAGIVHCANAPIVPTNFIANVL